MTVGAAVDLDGDDQRLRVVALAGDEAPGGLLDRRRRREVGAGGRLAPFRGLGAQLRVELAAQPRAGSAVEGEEARADGDRGDERDRDRQLGAQTASRRGA